MDVLLTSPWIPAEWVRAHGLAAHGIWFAKSFEEEAQPLDTGVCAFAESTVRLARHHSGAAVVFTTACDQLRRGFDDLARQRSSALLFNLPATRSPAARQLYRAELERLGQFLRECGGLTPTPEMLQNELEQTDTDRRRLRAAAENCTARRYAAAVAEFHGWGSEYRTGQLALPLPTPDPTPLTRPPFSNRIPLALIGSPLGEADWNLFDQVETAGGRVVLNATKTGEFSLCPTFEGWPTDPDSMLDTLVAGYFDHLVDVFQRPNEPLYNWLRPRLQSRHVRGIILWTFAGCDLWRAEMQTLRETFDLPVLLLEASAAAAVIPRDLTRLQAFLASLTRTPPRKN